ncbi:Neurofilament heavy protein [Citrus sinensis]|nr:Neurofilament heavy protein [Citrus sinensis]
MDETQTDGGDDFYEKIEAPKFVDLTAPDHYRPDNDDRYWFCLRVGCDQKHEEEMDSEVIYKNFVLRVMAARSPNVRLRKALYGKDPSAKMKCPLTVPAKTSKSRLALVSSISQKMVDGKVKGRPLFKQCETPKKKEKQSSVLAAKALTTPHNKKRLSNLGAFRSVRNPKPPALAVPKNRRVAKALVFHSPKKTVRMNLSKSTELSVRRLCAGMKKLEIASGKKDALGSNKPVPVDSSRKRFRGREVKSRVYDSLHPKNCQVKEAKFSTHLKKKNGDKEEVQTHCVPTPYEDSENDSSDMEIEQKSRNGSLAKCSISGTSEGENGNEHKECWGTQKTSELPLGENKSEAMSDPSNGSLAKCSISGTSEGESGNEHKECWGTQKTSELPLGENKSEAMSDPSRSEGTSLENCKEKNTGNGNVSLTEDQNGEGNITSERGDIQEQVKSSPAKGTVPSAIETDQNENASVSDDKENEGEVINNDDKENASASNDNRKLNPNTGHMVKKKMLGKHETSKGSQTVTKVLTKTSKGNSTPAVNCAGVNYGKPKLTNPKPFRLRTDERQILKEANLEKKLHHLEPGKETTTKTIHQSARNEKALEQNESASDARAGSEKGPVRRTRKTQPQRRGNSCPRTSKAAAERKESITPHRITVSKRRKSNLAASRQEFSQDKAAKKSQESLKRTKSLCMKQIARTRGIEPSKKKTLAPTTPSRLRMIKESSPTILRTEATTKPIKKGASPVTKASASFATRPSFMGRKPATIPKEPHFHSVHAPKSCTKRAA